MHTCVSIYEDETLESVFSLLQNCQILKCLSIHNCFARGTYTNPTAENNKCVLVAKIA